MHASQLFYKEVSEFACCVARQIDPRKLEWHTFQDDLASKSIMEVEISPVEGPQSRVRQASSFLMSFLQNYELYHGQRLKSCGS
jgi:hypothetical protein